MPNPPVYSLLDVLKACAPVLLALATILVLVRGARAGVDAADAEPETDAAIPLDRLLPALIAVAFYLIGLWRLSAPPEMIFDEVHHARTAMEFVAGKNPHEWTHPHFAKLMMAAGIVAWNGEFDPSDGAWNAEATYSERSTIGWRFPSLVSGTLALVVMYALARQTLHSRAAAALATTFLALDGVFFVQSRTAMTNIYTVFFILLAALGTWRYLREDRTRYLLLAGLGIGGALASRWSSLYAWALLMLALFLHHAYVSRRDGFSPARTLRWASLVVLGMIAVPAALYFASYIPYVLQGEQGTYNQKLFSLNYNQHGWGKVWTMQGDMWRYHSQLKEGHPYNSPWWSWPLVLRPVWYYWETDDGVTRGVWAIGNVFLWWASVPALVAAGVLAWKRRHGAIGFVVLLGLGQWLLWGVKARSLNFMHYMFESIPFVCLALAYLFHLAWTTPDPGDPAATAGSPAEFWTRRRKIVALYCILVAAWFVFFYPLLSALPIPQRFYDVHLWLGRPWI